LTALTEGICSAVMYSGDSPSLSSYDFPRATEMELFYYYYLTNIW